VCMQSALDYLYKIGHPDVAKSLARVDNLRRCLSAQHVDTTTASRSPSSIKDEN
jgi:hypothetical protein